MGSDLWLVIRWWITLFIVGIAAFPLTRKLFTSSKTITSSIPETNKSSKTKKVHVRDKDGLPHEAPPHRVGWWDQGYMFSKAVGMATVGWVVYIMGMMHLVPFSPGSIVLALGVVATLGIALTLRIKKVVVKNGDQEFATFAIEQPPDGWHIRLNVVAWEEIFFLVALLFWSWIKAHEPSLRGLEKFMDYGFMNSILHSTFFPPADMWYPPYPINYYYFGHLVTAVLTKLSGLDLGYTFNLMLATIFALCFTMSFSIAVELLRRRYYAGSQEKTPRIGFVVGGFFSAFLVSLAGNMQTIYAFTKGYTGEDVKPLWELLWPMNEFWAKLPEGLERYWYANATRFIPYTIHEFPAYSFVVSDIHGHVLSIPFVLLAIGILLHMFGVQNNTTAESVDSSRIERVQQGFYGFLVGVLLMTNALDGPIYFALFVLLWLFVKEKRKTGLWVDTVKALGVVGIAAVVSSAPFLSHFSSFVNGVALNCPWAAVANTKIGPLLFETVDKCQKSPFWMMYLLWGFFWFCGLWWIASRMRGIKRIRDIRDDWNTKFTHIEKVLVVFYVFSILLIIFPEFFYFKDIYPQHFRSNTMFKLGYQAFIMWSLMSGYVIAVQLGRLRRGESGAKRGAWLFLVLILPQLFLISIYPIFAVRSYFGGLKNYDGIWGLKFLQVEYGDDWNAIEWLNNRPDDALPGTTGTTADFPWPFTRETIVEADGDSYTDYERFSTFTGRPTIVGWAVHEWLWRGTYDVVAPRREEVRIIYESEDPQEVKPILDKYHVRYIIVGHFEREKFTNLAEAKFVDLGGAVYSRGDTTIYEVK